MRFSDWSSDVCSSDLAPGQSSTPAWIVTVDPQHNVLMSPKVRSDIPADASVQLWTHSKSMPAPRSLGLIDPNQPITVPATLMGTISPDQIFEMTLEPKGGSPTARDRKSTRLNSSH